MGKGGRDGGRPAAMGPLLAEFETEVSRRKCDTMATRASVGKRGEKGSAGGPRHPLSGGGGVSGVGNKKWGEEIHKYPSVAVDCSVSLGKKSISSEYVC